VATASVRAQAKVNLFLRVLAREASGYHQLETLFCRLALGDEVTVRLTSGAKSLDCRGEMMPSAGLGPVELNLAWRAAESFLKRTGWSTGFAIEIEKRIPVGGGLGGGSADGGAVLRALNTLAPEPLSSHELLALAAGLGADVPFLTQDASPLALGWGRGERLMVLPPLPERDCALFTFPFGVSTADAYRALTAAPAATSVARVYGPGDLASWDTVELMAYNEFERVVFPLNPDLAQVASGLRHPDLREAFDVVLLSGSGSTIFALPSLPDPGPDSDTPVVAIRIDASVPAATTTHVVLTTTAAHVERVTVLD